MAIDRPTPEGEIPEFYDIKIDMRRRVTQLDVDLWTACQAAYGRILSAVREIRAELDQDVERICKAHGVERRPLIPPTD